MTNPDDEFVTEHEAQARFSELLARVGEGEVITITRHGSPVAKLIPARSTSSQEMRREAIRLMRELADRNQLGGLRVKDLVAEGRR